MIAQLGANGLKSKEKEERNEKEHELALEKILELRKNRNITRRGQYRESEQPAEKKRRTGEEESVRVLQTREKKR